MSGVVLGQTIPHHSEGAEWCFEMGEDGDAKAMARKRRVSKSNVKLLKTLQLYVRPKRRHSRPGWQAEDITLEVMMRTVLDRIKTKLWYNKLHVVTLRLFYTNTSSANASNTETAEDDYRLAKRAKLRSHAWRISVYSVCSGGEVPSLHYVSEELGVPRKKLWDVLRIGPERSARSLTELKTAFLQEDIRKAEEAVSPDQSHPESSCDGPIRRFVSGKRKLVKRMEPEKPTVASFYNEEDSHEDWCFVCRDGGELMTCETCSRVAHIGCQPAVEEEAPFYCDICLQMPVTRSEWCFVCLKNYDHGPLMACASCNNVAHDYCINYPRSSSLFFSCNPCLRASNLKKEREI